MQPSNPPAANGRALTAARSCDCHSAYILMVNHISDPFPALHPLSGFLVLLRASLAARLQLPLPPRGCPYHGALSPHVPARRSPVGWPSVDRARPGAPC
ncbi:hypothetical protein LSAT2_003685, partial [Lamellibrachia satsuma]